MNESGAKLSFGFWNSTLASEDVAYGPAPVVQSSPCSDRPDLIVTNHPRAWFPSAEFALNLGEAGHNFIHGRTFRGILLDHVRN